MVSLGVNNHNQTIVFGATLVSNETKDTYIWLLEKFFDAMEQQVTHSNSTSSYDLGTSSVSKKS